MRWPAFLCCYREGVTIHRLAEMTWTEVDRLERDRTIAILPIGAIEAHGPHLPLCTDRLISEAMASAGAELLVARELNVVLLPPLDFTAAGFAAAFPGTLSLRPGTAVALLEDVARSLARHSFRWLAFANSHLDPEHLKSLTEAARSISEAVSLEEGGMHVVFPDLTRKPWALRLTEEFRSGACHAGRFESSVVLHERPDLVRDERRALAPNPSSLSVAIREGRSSFAEAGGPDAYFGDPAAASVEEGAETIGELGKILAEAVLEAREATP